MRPIEESESDDCKTWNMSEPDLCKLWGFDFTDSGLWLTGCQALNQTKNVKQKPKLFGVTDIHIKNIINPLLTPTLNLLEGSKIF